MITMVMIAITPKVVTAHAMVSNSSAVVIGFLTFSATIALGTRGVTVTRMSTTAAVTTTVFSIGRAHDRQLGRE